jgi:PAS domain S-box-containing protein
VLYIEPHESNKEAVGFDLLSDRHRREALVNAARSGNVVATRVVRLQQTKGREAGIILYLPVLAAAEGRGGEESGREPSGELRGFLSAVYTVDALLARPLAGAVGQGLRVQITDHTDTADVVYQSSPPESGAPRALMASSEVSFGSRRWQVGLGAGQEFAQLYVTGAPWWIGSTGSLITVLGTGLLMTLIRKSREIKLEVNRRTARLTREVRDRRRAEESLRVAENRYRVIFENAVEGIFQTTPTGQYLSANAALARMYGYSAPSELMVVLESISDQLYVDAGRRDDFIRLMREKGVVESFESRVFRRDGSIIWISENARAVRGDDGEVLYFEGMVVDITDRKASEEALRRDHDLLEERVAARTKELESLNRALQVEVAERKAAELKAAEASQAKTDFVHSLSHEIRTPMNAVLGYAQILQRDRQLSMDQRDAVDAIMSTGRHLVELINDILDLAQIESGQITVETREFGLRMMTGQLSAMFRQRCRDKGLRLEIHNGCGDETVRGDERKLRQVLINLCCNAIKFTDGGEVRVEVERVTPERVRFVVVDTGIGIPRAEQGTVFEPFKQAHPDRRRGGSGLGLSIVKRYVEAMGGVLWMESEEGRGSRFGFEIYLPLVRAGDEVSAREREELPGVCVPEVIRGAILAAADLHSLTELRVQVSRLEKEVAGAERLVGLMRDCLRRCDMVGIVDLLAAERDTGWESEGRMEGMSAASAGEVGDD